MNILRPIFWVYYKNENKDHKWQIANDKKKHALAGLFIYLLVVAFSLAVYELKPLFLYCVLATILIGGAKELIYDKYMKKGVASWKDFWATIIPFGFALPYLIYPFSNFDKNKP